MSNTNRKVAIIGAGLAGTTAGLGLVNAGFDVTIYGDRDRLSLRNDVPPTGTAVYFGKSLEYDAEVIEDLYDIGTSTGMSVRIFSGIGEARTPVIEFDRPFNYRAQAVDTRLRADDRLGRFLARGGKFVVRPVTPEDLDAIAADADLTLVATGKGGLSSLFPVDPDRTVYTEPQRHLLLATFKELDRADHQFAYRSSDGARHNWFNIHADFGETFFGPYLHKDLGATRAFIGFAKPSSPWIDIFNTVKDAQSARDAVVNLFATYFPEDAGLIDQLKPLHEDPHSWLLGAVSPTARRAVARTKNGHAVAAIGDAAVSFDPLGGQGAQNAVVQSVLLIRALKEHKDRITYEWLQDQFNKHWDHRAEAATEVTRLLLGDEKYATHAELLFPAAAVNATVGSAFFDFLSEPQPLLGIQSREQIIKFISDLAGETADNVLARFNPPEQLARAQAAERAFVSS
ncbi:flavin-dependent dehydrogenase [Bradyrhizobium sp. USDA 4524]|uniref:styrene monooxygenase/indole monooxygenase family protein n=1 Tax=unclassified Bradyrhizobium TaxID=2631580 RepID=UPI0020A1378C|nr:MULTISPECIES: styrene monooxygenase/indole monooxygenase family protein [unclassified Bradyrhizobium]MCP1845599.1 flavin-dependent dehydrogenase [Bradyrhizobium sp. USDA 4538]MCP1907078.1 flavin-dependent dehydrogenase [Bradyrhizobium sp. USDA 4537]MCP1985553.1 flavin-dependent dehydrogenase [Bradyrhizobium sp. USDA 4539]